MSERDVEVLLKFYESARQEIMSRIQLRENSLMIFLGAVAALVAASIQAQQPFFLIIIPYLSLGISLIILHHNHVIGALILYCAVELQQELDKLGINIIQWDKSKARIESSSFTRKYRLWGDAGLILTPSLLSIIINYNSWSKGIEYGLAMITAIGCIVYSSFLLSKTLKLRNKVFSELGDKTGV
jgi:hypothetical protein